MNMAYMTLKEANENRGVLSRQDNYFWVGGCITGVMKIAGVWLLSTNKEKSADRRNKESR